MNESFSVADYVAQVAAIGEAASQAFAAKNAARESALGRCREALRNSANCIRAVHRGDFATAEALVNRAGDLLLEARTVLEEHPDILYAGFYHDAAKEYVEARCTLALISGSRRLPGPADLQVEPPAYLNGLAEAVGELRRHLLDRLRVGDIERSEQCMALMDEVYDLIVTFDYPDAMTGGLRRTTDGVRGIVERSRGDLAVAARQRDFERSLAAFEERLRG